MRGLVADPRWRRPAAVALAAYAAAAVVVLPLSLARALTATEVHDTIGVSPSTFTLTTAGHSELRLGVAGTVYLPRSNGPLGLVATVDGPAETSGAPGSGGDLAAFVSPEMLGLYAGLFHDPETAVRGYVELVERALVRQALIGEVVLTAVAGTGLLVARQLLGVRFPIRHRRSRTVVAVASALVLSSVLAAWQLRGAGDGPRSGTYSLPALDGTQVEGATTDSPVLRLLLGDAIPKVQTLVRRQESATDKFRSTATAGLLASRDQMSGPREGETAVLMQSDMHCNEVMIAVQGEVRRLLTEQFGEDTPAFMAVTGDLTTNGTAAERSCIEQERKIAGDAPVAAVTGNHESELSAEHMKAAGMTVLDGSTEDVGDLSVLGDGDPERTELFGGTGQRGDESEADVGQRLRKTAEEDHPDLVLMHEAYAAAPFLGVTDMTTFLQGAGRSTVREEDGIDDVPASAVFYGHWHRRVPPRVLWNSDGTWTLVMELDTSGGAIDTPTVGHFSTPWTAPQQEASFPVVFMDRDTHLVTGYQIYSFDTDGSVTVEPRVEVGDPSTGTVTTPDQADR